MSGLVSHAQDNYLWWNDVHHWDGHTSWNQYMTYSTSFFGPNALPVPDVMNGNIDSLKTIEVDGGYNWSKGDKTKDTYIKGYLPLFKNRIAFVLDAVPIEWYKMDTVTRDLRAARNRSGEGKAGGDIYFQTLIALLKDHKKLPDVSLRIALRTASGTNLRNARYTDGPGYFFDLSAGKNFKTNSIVLRPYAMAGFYVYQTNDLEHLQNDCVMFGAGVDFFYKKII